MQDCLGPTNFAEERCRNPSPPGTHARTRGIKSPISRYRRGCGKALPLKRVSRRGRDAGYLEEAVLFHRNCTGWWTSPKFLTDQKVPRRPTPLKLSIIQKMALQDKQTQPNYNITTPRALPLSTAV